MSVSFASTYLSKINIKIVGTSCIFDRGISLLNNVWTVMVVKCPAWSPSTPAIRV